VWIERLKSFARAHEAYPAYLGSVVSRYENDFRVVGYESGDVSVSGGIAKIKKRPAVF